MVSEEGEGEGEVRQHEAGAGQAVLEVRGGTGRQART